MHSVVDCAAIFVALMCSTFEHILVGSSHSRTRRGSADVIPDELSYKKSNITADLPHMFKQPHGYQYGKPSGVTRASTSSGVCGHLLIELNVVCDSAQDIFEKGRLVETQALCMWLRR